MATFDIRPLKRRKTRRNDPLREDDVGALDERTIDRLTLQTRKGPVERKIFVPIPKATKASTSSNNIESALPEGHQGEGQFDQYADYAEPNLINQEEELPSGGRKARFENDIKLHLFIIVNRSPIF